MKDKSYIPALTGVRAIAAYLVFFHHYNQLDFPRPLFRVFNEFHIGVSLFFVLSGFLIAFRYYNDFNLSTAWFRKYIKNRIARIYPMYFLLTVATFLYAWYTKDNLINRHHPIQLLLLNLSFLRGFFNDFKFTGISQGWSLTVEECFYLLAPFFFVLIRKNRSALFYLPALILTTGILLVMLFSHVNFHGFYGNFRFMFLYTFTGRCIEFFVGIALALIVIKNKPYKPVRPLYTTLGIAGIGLCISILASIPLSTDIQFGLHHPLGIFTNNLLLPIAVATFFYGLIKEASLFRRFLSTGTMQLLGKSSYIFYLIHIGFIAVITSKYSKQISNAFLDWLDGNNYSSFSNQGVYLLLFLGSIFITLNLISIILYKLVEEPMNRLIRKFSLFVC